ncbi:CxxxxCH/CxxCH domain c-type cytochrome [Geomonas agri]|uniref:CxxxxCH/CxxCH domain c-type cytochrome n=1 Tax=Geomonas agri TaxID=2873702 RepID=UPI001CD5C939|nr:CxxxxCH/CxxCH domain-containing protein [Geomonas agri]
MNANRIHLPTRLALGLIGAASLMIIASCGDSSTPAQTAESNQQTVVAKGAEVNTLPSKGKVTAAVAPAKAVFGMIWINTAENREYIFDGADWVPHDQSVDEFYAAKALETKNAAKTVMMTQDEVCLDGDPACTPTGAHGGHGSYDCQVCHNVGGQVSFARTAPNNLAYGSGLGIPAFSAATKTCSNIACHAIPVGTFSFYTMDGSGDLYLETVSYGSAAQSTPAWNSTGPAGCSACHGDPPRNGSTGSNVWHSGYHGGQGPTGARNQCQFCHPDASSPNNGVGDTITNSSLHANGVVNVQAKFTSACFGCH